MKTDAKTRSEYFSAVGDREKDIRKLDKIIRQSAPDLKPHFMGMLAYGKYRYKYASGREGDWCVMALGAQKHYMSLYVCVGKNGKYLAEIYGDRLGKVNCGKSCIRFKKLEDLDLDVVGELVREAGELARSGNSFQM